MSLQTITTSLNKDYLNYLNNQSADRLYPPLRYYEDEDFHFVQGQDNKTLSIAKSGDGIKANINGSDFTDNNAIRLELIHNVFIVNQTYAGSTEIVTKLDEILFNLGLLAGSEIPFEENTGINEINYPSESNEYLVYIFRVKPGSEKGFIKKYSVSTQSVSSDNYLIKVGMNKDFDHAFINLNWSDVASDSKLQFARPGVNSVPPVVIVNPGTGFLPGGRNLNSKYGGARDELMFDSNTPIEMLEDIHFISITLQPKSSNANISTSINWSEQQ